MKSCVFPGSFDPVTVGHLDLISRAAALFDRVTVVIMINIHKKGVFPTEARLRMMKDACRGWKNVRVEAWEGLLADYMREKGERCVLRGVRGVSEYSAETETASVNRQLNPEMETLLMPASGGLAGVSSSAVREIAAFGGDISSFVPACAVQEITEALSNK